MSVKVMSAVFERYPVGGGEMLLALALADVARDDGVLMLNRSVAELAEKTRQTVRGVQLQLRRMEATGWLIAVRASDGGRGRVSTYRINIGWIIGGPLATQALPETPNGATENHEPRSGLAQTETLNAATLNPERGSGAIEPEEPNTEEIPPNPPRGARPASKKPPASAAAGGRPPQTLKAWLAECEAKGEKPIPPGDPVFEYCATVGIGNEVLALHWREFKLRRMAARKRQADWRATFRNSVRDNWFRLWFLKPGFDAQLTTTGQQAQALMRAEQAERERRRAAEESPA